MGTWGGSLENGTDAIYAIVARDVANGNWFAPEIAGGPYLMKPPLYFWLCGISLQVFGGFSDIFALRLPGVVSGWFVVFLTAEIAGRIAGSRRAWALATLLVLLNPIVIEYSRRVFMEETLAATMLLVLYGAVRAKYDDDPRWLWLVGLGTAGAILTKSYGGGFAGLAVLLWFAISGPRVWLKSRPFVLGIAAGSLILFAYVGVMWVVSPEEFLHQNLLPFKLGTEAQFSWYQTGPLFYLTAPFSPEFLTYPWFLHPSDPSLDYTASGIDLWVPVLAGGLIFIGGWLALILGTARSVRTPELSGLSLLLIYIVSGYLIWGSLSQQRHYYLVPFLPVLSAGAAVMLDRILPTGRTPSAATLLLLAALVPLAHPLSFHPLKLDPEPGLATLGKEVQAQLPEGATVYRFGDLFAGTEYYTGRRTVSLTSPGFVEEFGRILVVGERDIAVLGGPNEVFQLVSQASQESPFFMVISQGELERVLPHIPGLHQWSSAEDRGSTLLLVSTLPPPP
jgi:4-amino-4-deoxy-L-arabinose transferase-like glycosyltransferase